MLLLLLLTTRQVFAQVLAPADGQLPSFADPLPETSAPPPEEEPPPELSPFWADFKVSGYLKNETAYRFHEPRSITKIRNIAYLNVQHPVTEKGNFNFTGWTYYDLAYDLFDYQTISGRSTRDKEEPLVFIERLPQEKDSPVAEIRELYLDWYINGADVRVGKQFIIWGVLEGVRVVDELNPMDFRELILLDLLDYRIPLWSIKTDIFFGNDTLHLVAIPEMRFHEPAPRGSEWELLQNVCVGQEPEIVCQESVPDSWELKNTEFGVKYDTTLWDTELTFSYFYTWDDFPVIFRAVPLDTARFCGRDNIPENECLNPAFFPTYSRMHMYGTTAVKQMGRYIFKGELAYVTGKYFGIKNTTDLDQNEYVDNDGEYQRDHIRWGFGVEFNIAGMDVAPGVTQWVIPDYDEALLQKRYDTSFNIFMRKEIPERAAVFQFLGIYLYSMREMLLMPKVTFQIDDRLQMGVGANLFYGVRSDFGVNQQAESQASTFDLGVNRAQFIGNFHDNDRVFMEFKYSF